MQTYSGKFKITSIFVFPVILSVIDRGCILRLRQSGHTQKHIAKVSGFISKDHRGFSKDHRPRSLGIRRFEEIVIRRMTFTGAVDLHRSGRPAITFVNLSKSKTRFVIISENSQRSLISWIVLIVISSNSLQDSALSSFRRLTKWRTRVRPPVFGAVLNWLNGSSRWTLWTLFETMRCCYSEQSLNHENDMKWSK